MLLTLRSDIANYVITRIEEFGVKVSAGSRLWKMHRATVNPDGSGREVPFDSPDYQVALEANRDLQLLNFIFRHIEGDAPSDDFRLRLKRLIKDSALPQDDSSETKGRNEQLELYVFAICAKAGLEPVFAEPDIICNFKGEKYAIAAKRLKSLNEMKSRFTDGMRQIQRSGLQGCVVADISVALNPGNRRVGEMGDYEFGVVSEREMRVFVDKHTNEYNEWRKETTAQGIILIDHHVRVAPTRGWGLDTLTFVVNLSLTNWRRRRQFDTFALEYEKGLPTPAFRYGKF